MTPTTPSTPIATVRSGAPVGFVALLRCALASLTVACHAAGGGDGGTDGTSGGMTSAGSMATTMTTTSSSSGNPPPDPDCVDAQDPNDDPSLAHELDVEGGDITVVQRQGRLCDQASDWFRLTAPCRSFLGIETRVVEGGGGGDESGAPPEVTRIGTRLFQQLPPTAPLRETTGTFALHPMHAELQPGLDYYVQVEHVDTDPVEYTLRLSLLPDGTCTSASFLCEANATAIAATETSCEAFPTGSSCHPSHVHDEAVPLPLVSDGASGWTPGWAIHVDASEVRNVHRPTSSEAAMLEARCIEACEAEWGQVAAIDADCDASGAFDAIVLRDRPSLPARALVPPSQQDASGLFVAESLACNVHTDCCEAFSSHLCPLRPDRVTPALEPLLAGSREQYVHQLGSSSVTFQGGPASTTVSGVARFSDGDRDGSEQHAVYLSDVFFASDDPVEVELDCSDGTQASPEVELFAFGLVQPAFGIRKDGTDQVAFPPGALVFRIGVMVDSEVTWADGANELPLYGTIVEDDLSLLLAQVVRVPCGAGTADLALAVDLGYGSTIAHPPDVTITIPATITCPSTVSLAATVTDPESDVDTVRWSVDGVLLRSTLTSVDVRSGAPPMTFAAVACDSRGACSRREKVVSCS